MKVDILDCLFQVNNYDVTFLVWLTTGSKTFSDTGRGVNLVSKNLGILKRAEKMTTGTM